MKKCPYCAEEVKDEAIKCKHCQSNLQITRDDDLKKSTKTVVLTIIKLFLGASFGLFIFIFIANEIIFQIDARDTMKRAEEATKRAEESRILREKLQQEQEEEELKARLERIKKSQYYRNNYETQQNSDCLVKHCQSENEYYFPYNNKTEDIEIIDY